MKIIHISIARKITSGQKRQLEAEFNASQKILGVAWKTIAYDDFKPDRPFMRRIPAPFRHIFLRNLFGWIISVYYARKCDYIMLRHMTFDPFSLFFSLLIRNRISVHHSKEVEELKLIRRGWRGKLASSLERWAGAFALRRAVAVAGVTREIASYEKERSNSSAKGLMFPNGINVEAVTCLDDARRSDVVNIAFMCGSFSEWHGLDILIDKAQGYRGDIFRKIEKIHLIGHVFPRDLDAIQSNPILNKLFCVYGRIVEEEYRDILNVCDIGMSSFALQRKDLFEASTLKVRELLAMGLPIYSGHVDCALGGNFVYYRYCEEIDIDLMTDFALEMKGHDRHAVARSARTFIDKRLLMDNFVRSLKSI